MADNAQTILSYLKDPKSRFGPYTYKSINGEIVIQWLPDEKPPRGWIDIKNPTNVKGASGFRELMRRTLPQLDSLSQIPAKWEWNPDDFKKGKIYQYLGPKLKGSFKPNSKMPNNASIWDTTPRTTGSIMSVNSKTNKPKVPKLKPYYSDENAFSNLWNETFKHPELQDAAKRGDTNFINKYLNKLVKEAKNPDHPLNFNNIGDEGFRKGGKNISKDVYYKQLKSAINSVNASLKDKTLLNSASRGWLSRVTGGVSEKSLPSWLAKGGSPGAKQGTIDVKIFNPKNKNLSLNLSLKAGSGSQLATPLPGQLKALVNTAASNITNNPDNLLDIKNRINVIADQLESMKGGERSNNISIRKSTNKLLNELIGDYPGLSREITFEALTGRTQYGGKNAVWRILNTGDNAQLIDPRILSELAKLRTSLAKHRGGAGIVRIDPPRPTSVVKQLLGGVAGVGVMGAVDILTDEGVLASICKWQTAQDNKDDIKSQEAVAELKQSVAGAGAWSLATTAAMSLATKAAPAAGMVLGKVVLPTIPVAAASKYSAYLKERTGETLDEHWTKFQDKRRVFNNQYNNNPSLTPGLDEETGEPVVPTITQGKRLGPIQEVLQELKNRKDMAQEVFDPSKGEWGLSEIVYGR